MNGGQRTLAPRSHRISWLPAMAASLAVTALASCAALPRLDAVPESLTEQATVPGIPDSPNLRRSYGSLLLNAGANAEVIQELLGHADMRMTRRVYAHLLNVTIANTVKSKLPSFGHEKSNVRKLRP